ncbi:MAG TPA: ATP-dependent DNA ligase [Thermoanaerobaculia bacterium]
MTAYRALAETLEEVAAMRGRLAKVARLAQMLARVDEGELPAAARLLSGSAFAEHEEAVTSVGYATILRAASAVTGWDEETVRACAVAIGDLGEAVGLLRPPDAAGGMTILEADLFFRALAGLRKPAEKREALEEMLRRTSAVEAKYLLKTLSGGLRIGADVTTVEEAIAQAFGRNREAVARARRDSGDVGETAAAARADRLGEIRFRLFHPIGFMLASPIESAEEIAGELPDFAVEDKFDGIRAHAHMDGERVALFSRTLDDVTEQFPEVARELARLDGSFLLDGEIVAWQEGEGAGRPASFFRLQRRLGRKAPDASLLEEIPTAFVAYDCLARGERPLFEESWESRRRELEAAASGTALRVSEVFRAETPEELEALFAAARARGNEGLMLKRRDSPYQAGKRGRAWRKWKKALASIDVVVTAVEQGHGKRAGMLSDYTFAVRAPEGEEGFVNIGKAYSGLSDEEIRTLSTRFRKSTVARYGPVRAVTPEVVIEVSFDSIQKSARHKSGFALRFPRIVRLRPDRSPADATTLEEVRELYERLAGVG